MKRVLAAHIIATVHLPAMYIESTSIFEVREYLAAVKFLRTNLEVLCIAEVLRNGRGIVLQTRGEYEPLLGPQEGLEVPQVDGHHSVLTAATNAAAMLIVHSMILTHSLEGNILDHGCK